MDSTTINKNFITEIIQQYISKNKNSEIITRFPPEPNGYLHIGHAKSICLNFGISKLYNGKCYLRFDDTNPTKENKEYVESIKEDIKWLGFDPQDHIYYTSDYFDQLYEWAVFLIKNGKAYVDEQSYNDIKKGRGSLTKKGKNSPYRDRAIEDNLVLFSRMKSGEFETSKMVLRAKISMDHPNLNMRDPIIYRILHETHHRTKNKWCIYPMYDFAHGQSDAIEGVTHSLCTLEFENHRPLYEWFINNLPISNSPRQIEFARLNLTHTVLSKRVLSKIVTENIVDSWNDPRMPTIAGMRRLGYPPEAIRNFCETIGITKYQSTHDISILENSVREVLNRSSHRFMAVLDPLKITITNYPNNKVETLESPINPNNPDLGNRKISFSKHIYIDKNDFKENANRKFFRLSNGKEVRLRSAYFIKCNKIIKNSEGEIVKLECTYDPDTRGGKTPPDGRKVKGTIHWVNQNTCINAEIRMYDRLFKTEKPESLDDINLESIKVIKDAKLENNLSSVSYYKTVQFERIGYFCRESDKDNIIFNKTISLKEDKNKI